MRKKTNIQKESFFQAGQELLQKVRQNEAVSDADVWAAWKRLEARLDRERTRKLRIRYGWSAVAASVALLLAVGVGFWVTERDDVFVLGDMFYRKKEGVEEILKKLKGRKHLIIGNHDYSWMKSIELRKYFVETETLLVLKEEGRVMTLCHYPIMSWPHMYHGSYCIFGHIHNSANNADYWPLIESNPYLLNAGVDVNNFYPVTFEELKRNNEVFKEKARETKQEIIT